VTSGARFRGQPEKPDNGMTTLGPNGRWTHNRRSQARFRRSGPGKAVRETPVGWRRNERCSVENRRRQQRQPAGWVGSYQLAGEYTTGWRDCRVVDISMLGLGITFDHPNPSELAGRLVSVNLPGNGSCVNVRLEGQIKNASAMLSRDIRVGIEFIRLSETEQAITAVLSVMSDVLVST
jgi:PilZ domain